MRANSRPNDSCSLIRCVGSESNRGSPSQSNKEYVEALKGSCFVHV